MDGKNRESESKREKEAKILGRSSSAPIQRGTKARRLGGTRATLFLLCTQSSSFPRSPLSLPPWSTSEMKINFNSILNLCR